MGRVVDAAERMATMRYLESVKPAVAAISGDAAYMIDLTISELGQSMVAQSAVTIANGNALAGLIYALPDVQDMGSTAAATLRAAIHLLSAPYENQRPARSL